MLRFYLCHKTAHKGEELGIEIMQVSRSKGLSEVFAMN